MAPGTGAGRHVDPGDDAIEICRSLIRIDTTNPGRPERPATELVAAILSDLTLDPVMLEPEPGRTSVVARIAGQDSAAGGLLVHGHLDVVPADPAGWRYPPFSGEVAEGCVWGRGAVDMKGPVAMVLAALRARLREGRLPRTDVVVAFVADEERGSRLGAQFVVDERPDLFEGCRVAIGEVGGFSSALGGERAYLVQTAERGVAWTELGAAGVPGHGSLLAEDSALVNLAGVVARLGGRPLALRASETNLAFAAGVLRRLGVDEVELDRLGPDELLERLDKALGGLGPIRRMLAASVRNTANPTGFEAGVSPNVVPATARAVVDGRFVPGHEAALDAELAEVCGERVVRRPLLRLPGIESPPAGPFVGAMARALARVDPGASVLPFTWPGFTDAKQFARLGIDCYGFMPLDLPAGFDFSSVFHAPDERVPEEALRFGVRVLDALFDEDWSSNEESAGQRAK